MILMPNLLTRTFLAVSMETTFTFAEELFSSIDAISIRVTLVYCLIQTFIVF